MKPPYDITPKILKLISSISEKIGEVNANYLTKPSPLLREQNRIKTIGSTHFTVGSITIYVMEKFIIEH